MHFKLIIALVDDSKTSAVVEAARQAGATGATILGDARGEGLEPRKTFFGLTMEASRDMLIFKPVHSGAHCRCRRFPGAARQRRGLSAGYRGCHRYGQSDQFAD